MRLRRRDDAGQLVLLVIFYGLIAAMLVMVVIDGSKVFLARRSLAAAADGAALAAAQSIDRAAFYRNGPGSELQLDVVAAEDAVRRYVEQNGLARRFMAFSFDAPRLSPDGRTVTVRLHCQVPLPLPGIVTGGQRTSSLDAQASAQAATS
ncbi:MAG: hypothetical protein QOG53_1206 [Frankiales bacterium]|jgi:uncharacterized membrane protein|nr:hypothetical protein [Frankiales bacterium]